MKLRDWKCSAAWGAVIVLYFAIYGFRLSFPPVEYYDEVYFTKIARGMLHLHGSIGDAHPPFAKYLMALSIFFFGDHSWAWRLPSLLAGLGALILVYAIAKEIFQSTRAAFFSAFIFFFDCISFTQARIAMLNAVMLFLMLLSLYCLLRHATAAQWSRKKAFVLCALFLALALGSRLVAGGILFVLAYVYYSKLWKQNERTGLLKDTLALFLPVLVLAYFSLFLIMPFIPGYHWSSIWKYQLGMMRYHLTLDEPHLYASRWWTWPLMIRPIWFYFKEEMYVLLRGHYSIRGIICIGNPAVIWVFPAAAGFLARLAWKNRSWTAGFVLAGFLTQWLPWALVKRTEWFHHFYGAMPFVVMAVAMGLDALWQKSAKGRWLAAGYLVLVVGMFVYWYPLLNGMAVSDEFYKNHMWLRSWG